MVYNMINMKKYYSSDKKMRLNVLKWFEEDGVTPNKAKKYLMYIEPQILSTD